EVLSDLVHGFLFRQQIVIHLVSPRKRLKPKARYQRDAGALPRQIAAGAPVVTSRQGPYTAAPNAQDDPMTSLPSRMTAIAIRAPGGPDVLVPEERPAAAPGEGEILVKVTAAGVNRPDVMQRQGLYPPPPGASDIPGLEIAGEVASLGPGA